MVKRLDPLLERSQESIETPRAGRLSATAAAVMLLISTQGASAQEPVPQENPLFSLTMLGGIGSFSKNPAVIGDKFATNQGVISGGTSQEFIARIAVPTGKEVFGGDLDIAVQGSYSTSSAAADFAGISSNFDTSQKTVGVLAGPMIRWDLGNGFEADAGALAGVGFTQNRLDFIDNGSPRSLTKSETDFKWEVVGGLSKEVADGFRVRVEGFVGSKPSFHIEENGGYLDGNSGTQVGGRIGFTKNF